jgi:O-antigen ligase
MEQIRKFINGNYFIALVFAITILVWWLNLAVIAMVAYIFFIILIIALNANRITLITVVLAALICFRQTSIQETAPIIIIAGLCAIPFLIYDILKTKIDFKNPIFISLFAFLVANVLSLVNATSDTFSWGILGIGQTFGFVFLFLYLTSNQKEGDYHYFSKATAALGIAVAIEFLIYVLTYTEGIIGKDIRLGWGMSNTIAMLLTMVIPITYYLYIEDQSRKYVLAIVVIEFVVAMLMLSKGAYIALLAVFFLLAVLAFSKIKDRKTLFKDHLFALALLLIIAVIILQIDTLWEGFKSYLKVMDSRGWFDDDSRFKIYRTAYNVFRRFPLFGSGSYTSIYYLVEGGFAPGLVHYHNIFLHSMATLGIVGLLSFLYFLYTSIKSCFINNSYNIAVLIAFIAMIIHGMVDNTWYNPLVMIFILSALAVLAKVKKPNLVLN